MDGAEEHDEFVDGDMMPVLQKKNAAAAPSDADRSNTASESTPIMIRKNAGAPIVPPALVVAPPRVPAVRKPRSAFALVPMYAGAVATIVVVVTFGYSSLKQGSSYAAAKAPQSQLAAVASVIAAIGDTVTQWFSHDLVYTRHDR